MAVTIGFVGSGGIANAHMNVLQGMEDVKLTAFADPQIERAENAAARFEGRAYSDYREMLEKEKLDAVYVCVPPYAHEEQELIAARKGMHLFIEKPIALSMDKAQEIKKAIDTSGVVVCVGYHWRYTGTAQRAKEILGDQPVGMVLGYWMGGMPGVSWWRVMNESGGQMVEQTTHIFDLARYLAGDVVEVYAAYATRCLQDVPNFDVSDVGTATLKFANGAVGTISNTCILGQGYTVGLHVAAKDLVLEVDGGGLKVIRPGRTEIIGNSVNAFQAENQAFVSAVRTGDASGIKSSYEDAMKTLALTLAANESAKTGKPVKL